MPDGDEIADAGLRVDGSLPTALSGRYLCLEPNLAGARGFTPSSSTAAQQPRIAAG